MNILSAASLMIVMSVQTVRVSLPGRNLLNADPWVVNPWDEMKLSASLQDRNPLDGIRQNADPRGVNLMTANPLDEIRQNTDPRGVNLWGQSLQHAGRLFANRDKKRTGLFEAGFILCAMRAGREFS